MRTEIRAQQARMCFNSLMLTNVHFGHAIFKSNTKQVKELKKICESPMIRKLAYVYNFPGKFLCAQKSCLEIGIIKPNAVKGTLEIKLCVGNKRSQAKVNIIASVQEECSFVDSRMAKEGINRHMIKRCWSKGWAEEVENKINTRKIEIIECQTQSRDKKITN